jgi:APA family basic amino acid/polyamine antiporter
MATVENTDRALPSRFVLAVVVGGVIGLGILRGPGEIADVVREPSLYLSLWLAGGLFVLLSTAVTAELLGLTPRSGGTYSLIRRAYGPYPGFVLGWVDWLSFAADLALKAVVIMEFTAILFPGAAAWQTPLAIAVTTIFAAIQLRGISLGALIQELATSLIGLFIVALSLVLLFVDAPMTGAPAATPAKGALGDWSLVIATIIFTYDGWLYASYFSGELQGGAGTAARSCIKGMVVVIALYMLINFALVQSAGLPALAGSELALARALELATSPAAGNIILVAAILILLGHQNLEYMSGPRILQALAVDGLATKRAQEVGSGGNPVFAVIVTWSLAVGLILVGGFDFLLLLSVFFYVPIYLAMIVGVMILRRREPARDRPYRAWGHPYSTVVCLVGWTIITVFQAYAERETALYAVAMTAVSWPVYRYLARR